MTRRTFLAAGIGLSVVAMVFFARQIVAGPPGVTGAIVSVDANTQRIRVVETSSIEYWFQCTESTTLTLNGFAASFNQLAPGQRVEVQYEPDTFIAIQVDATSR